MGALLFFRRTRPAGWVLGVGFACLVGSIVYGFGSIVLATLMSLPVTYVILAPLARLRITDFLRRYGTPQTWRLGFAAAITVVFLIDHATGFTLADRGWMFGPGERLTTADVLTPMQLVWFLVSTMALVSVLVAAYRNRSTIVTPIALPRVWVAYALPVFLLLSEAGIYTGLKESPNIAMFSGVNITNCLPNHLIARDHFYSSFFHRDLLFVTNAEGERVGIPALSLRARSDRAERHGINAPLVDRYRSTPTTRLRGGVEEPFAFDDLDDLPASSWLEVVLPRRLFSFGPLSETDLRCSMPELFAAPAVVPR